MLFWRWMTPALALWLGLTVVVVLLGVDAAKFAPNHFLGKCLDDQWVRDVAAKLNISTTERDELLRLKHPHFHAALTSRRLTVRDPRINGKAMSALFTPTCTSSPFTFWGVGATVDAATGAVTDIGTADGSLVVEFKGWTSFQLATFVFSILAQEVLGYRVSFYKGDAVGMGARMSSASEGLCTPIHVNVEEWGRDYSAYANELFKTGVQSYVGRSGLYTTKKFVDQGADPTQSNPAFDADFWRDYTRSGSLIAALDPALIWNNTKYYPPPSVTCPDGIRGCKNSCSRTDTCTEWENNNKLCFAIALMTPAYDEGWAEAVLANNKIPSYHCFLGYDGVESYAVEMEAKDVPVVFYHYEPDPFHFVHADKFRRVFLPRSLPELTKLSTGKFGENGYGTKTNNPIAVDFAKTTLSLYAATLIQDHPPLSTLLSRMTLFDIDMNALLKTYVDIASNGTEAIEANDPAFSSACSWIRENYDIWSRWLDRLPLCSGFTHMDYKYEHCTDGKPRQIVWSWKNPDPEDPSKSFECDGGQVVLPPAITTSKSCEWLAENIFEWIGWTLGPPPCDEQFYSFRVSSCDSKAKRTAEYYWLLPDPTDVSKSIECTGGSALPEPVEIACEFTPYQAPLFQVIAIIAICLAAILTCCVGFVVKYRDESIIKRSQFEFLTVMIVGGIIMCGAAVVYAGEPTNFLCGARPVLTSLGFTLIFGSLVVKTMRVYRVFMSGAMKRVVLSTRTMFKILGLFVLVDAVILVAWFLFDFPAPYLTPVSIGALKGATINHHVCMSSSFIFTALLMFWKAIVLFMGLYLSFLIRNVSTDFQESIWIFASALVVLFGSIIILPMAYLVELPANVFYAFLGFMLLSCTALVMSMMLVPKMRRLHEQSNDSTVRETTRTNGDRSSNGTSEDTKQNMKASKIRLGMKAQVQVTPVGEFRPKSASTDTNKNSKKKKKKSKLNSVPDSSAPSDEE